VLMKMWLVFDENVCVALLCSSCNAETWLEMLKNDAKCRKCYSKCRNVFRNVQMLLEMLEMLGNVSPKC
jgi:Zn finger protein HypA/HybF involved in hydrogenase expression